MAIGLVVFCHFFLHNGFNSAPFHGPVMVAEGFMQTMGVGAQLFMMLTGYLCINKCVSRNYFCGCGRVLLSYLFFSLLTLAVRVWVLHDGMTIVSGLLGILRFSTIPYAWYIEMWIGLFLLCPFLNLVYRGLESKRHKLLLIGILIVCCSLPNLINRYGLYVVPQFWSPVWPLLYYFSGCFIREYQPQIRTRYLWLTIIGIGLINPLITTAIPGEHSIIHIIGNGPSPFIYILTSAIFLLCYKVQCGVVMSAVMRRISLDSLDMYLACSMFDMLLYPLFAGIDGGEPYGQMVAPIWFFVIPTLVLIFSWLACQVKRGVFYVIGIGKL